MICFTRAHIARSKLCSIILTCWYYCSVSVQSILFCTTSCRQSSGLLFGNSSSARRGLHEIQAKVGAPVRSTCQLFDPSGRHRIPQPSREQTILKSKTWDFNSSNKMFSKSTNFISNFFSDNFSNVYFYSL